MPPGFLYKATEFLFHPPDFFSFVWSVTFTQKLCGRVVHSGNYRSVITRREGDGDCRFGIVRRSQPASLDLCLLSAFPIVVSHDSRAIRVAQIQEWIRQ